MIQQTQSSFVFRRGRLSVAVIMTGGTIAKSYHPSQACLYNFELKITELIEGLRIDDLQFTYLDLMQKDSINICDADRDEIVSAVAEMAEIHDAILVTHGTDSMTDSGERLCTTIGTPPVPVIFTGAMVPFTITGTDAVQNVTEALLALRMLPAGTYISFHNRIMRLPGVHKDYDSLTFAES